MLLVDQITKYGFHTVNHNILIKKLYYGTCGNLIKWFESYLTNRTQYVFFKEKKSDTKKFLWSTSMFYSRSFIIHYLHTYFFSGISGKKYFLFILKTIQIYF